MKRLALLLLILGAVLTIQNTHSSVAEVDEPYVAGEVIVKFNSGIYPTSSQSSALQTGDQSLDELLATFKVTGARLLFENAPTDSGAVYVLEVSEDVSPVTFAAELSGESAVAYAEPNYLLSIHEQRDVSSARSFSGSALPAQPVATEVQISNYYFLYQSEFLDFDIQWFLETIGSPLANYSEEVAGSPWSAAEIFHYNAIYHGINPQIILMAAEVQAGIITSSNDLTANPALLSGNGLYGYVNSLANQLLSAYDAHRFLAETSATAQAATVALSSVLGASLFDELNTLNDAWFDVSLLTGGRSLAPMSVTATGMESYRFPFPDDERWYYTGGPHSYTGAEARPWSAVDLAPLQSTPCPENGSSTYEEDAWIVAAADGKVIVATQALVVIEHPDGWRTYYSHVSSVADQIAKDSEVRQGDRIGHPSCEVEPGGKTTGIHLHFAIWSGGESGGFQDINGHTFSEWQITESTFYNGTASRYAVIKTASVYRTENNLIPSSFTSDPRLNDQWALHNTGQTGGNVDSDIDAPEGWNVHRGSNTVTIAIIDTGVDYNHEDLNDGRILTNLDKDFVNDDMDALDDNGHGTHVAGIVAAETNNGVGIAGIMWQANILPLKVCNASGSCSADDIAAAIRYAADNGARIINLSLGGSCSQTIADAVNYAYFDKGVTVIASAGNSGGSISYPAKHAPVIAVGASDSFDSRAFFSSYGEALDFVAPGVGILSTVPNNGYDALSGTSMSAPHVTGVAGLILSQKPDLAPGELREILRQSTDDLGEAGFDKFFGYGRLNANNALQLDTPTEPSQPEAAKCSGCAATTALEGESDAAELLQNLYRLRDALGQSEKGQDWVSTYYKYEFEVAWLVATDSQLRGNLLEAIRAFDPAISAILNDPANDQEMYVTQEMVTLAETVLSDIANQGSTEIGEIINTEWSSLNPYQYIGWDVRAAWVHLTGGQSTTYLPFIQK